MKLDKICRTCLSEKTALKSLFGACLPSMLMSCASVQVMEGDGLPNKICTQCLQMVNRAYTFKQQCEKSDATLREYVNKINMQNIALTNNDNLMCNVKGDQLFGGSEVLQQTSFFTELFGSDTTESLVDDFTSQNANTVVSDLADTMQSLQTIAEQCLPDTWDNETNMMSSHSASKDTTCNSFQLEPLLKCQFCEETFGNEWSLTEHTKMHTNYNKYYCNNCGKEYSSPEEPPKGTPGHIGGPIMENKKSSNCHMCEKQNEDSSLARKPNKNVPSTKVIEKKHVCAICGKRYSQNKFLVIHIRSHTGERPLNCEICGKNFSLPSSLHKHRLVHNQERRFNCSVCGKAFKQMSHVTAHMRSHTGEKPFICNVCGKGCATNVNLEIHKRLHTGEKPYHCSRCDSRFTTGSQLKKHFTRHTGEKPYKCSHCGKTFRQKDTRDTHVRYHTGERPYACRLCFKRYIAASHLRVHMKGHTGDRKYQCNICSKAFVQARTLKTHLATHTGEKNFLCKHCGQSYCQASTLNKHIKTCHAGC